MDDEVLEKLMKRLVIGKKGIIDNKTLSYWIWKNNIKYDRNNYKIRKVFVEVIDFKFFSEFEGVKEGIKYFLFFSVEKDDTQPLDEFFFLYYFNEKYAIGHINFFKFITDDDIFDGLIEIIKNKSACIAKEIEQQLTELNAFSDDDISDKIILKNFNMKYGKPGETDKTKNSNNLLLYTQADILDENGPKKDEKKSQVFSNQDYRIIITDKKFCEIDFDFQPKRDNSCVIIVDYCDNASFWNENEKKLKDRYTENMEDIKCRLKGSGIDFYINGRKDETEISDKTKMESFLATQTAKEKIQELFKNENYKYIFLCAHNQADHIALARYEASNWPDKAPDNYINVEQELPKKLEHIEEIELFLCYSLEVATRSFLMKGVGVCNGNLGPDDAFEAIERLEEIEKIISNK